MVSGPESGAAVWLLKRLGSDFLVEGGVGEAAGGAASLNSRKERNCCGLPSSATWKSSSFNPLTARPLESVTTTSTTTALLLTLNVGMGLVLDSNSLAVITGGETPGASWSTDES